MTAATLASPEAKPRQKLLAWHRRHGRDLPWRRNPHPWAVVVSEFLLQQTTVAAVRPRFEHWMRAFPTPAAMARAEEAEVLALWQGLGYYRRAALLHQAAKEITENHGGEVPAEAEALARLPGFGAYTTAAVLAFAFDRPVPVLDANILRVGARLGDIRKPVDTAAGRLAIERVIRGLLPRGRGGRAFTSALMDLGALTCRPRAPLCPQCPLQEICKTQDPASLPVKRPRLRKLELRDFRAWIRGPRGIALVPSPGPWWKGLWLLPPAQAGAPAIHSLRFTVTRHLVQMEICEGGPLPPGARWFPPGRLPPMPSPHLRAVRALSCA